MLIDRTGHNTSGNIFQKIGVIDTSDFSMFGPYDDLVGYSVRMGTKYGFADYTGQLLVPCEYEKEIHLFPVAGRYQFIQWEEGYGVVPLQEAGPEDDALYQAIQRHFEQKATLEDFAAGSSLFLEMSQIFSTRQLAFTYGALWPCVTILPESMRKK